MNIRLYVNDKPIEAMTRAERERFEKETAHRIGEVLRQTCATQTQAWELPRKAVE